MSAVCSCITETLTATDSKIIHEINYREIPAGRKTIAITGATVIDGNRREPVQNGCVVVENGKILRWRKWNCRIPEGRRNGWKRDIAFTGIYRLAFSSGRPKRSYFPVFATWRYFSAGPGAWIEAYDGERGSGKAVPRLFLADPHLDMFPPAYPKDAYVVRMRGGGKSSP